MLPHQKPKQNEKSQWDSAPLQAGTLPLKTARFWTVLQLQGSDRVSDSDIRQKVTMAALLYLTLSQIDSRKLADIS